MKINYWTHPNNEKINTQDMLLLMFAPLMNKKHVGEIILKMVKLTNKINADEKTKNKIKSRHIHLTNNFVKDLKLKNQIKEVIEMGSHFINDFIDPDFNKEIEMRIENGMKNGIEKGMKEGMKEGRKEGLKEGMERKEIEIIKNLFNQNFSAEQISNMLNIPIERINNL